MSGVGGGGGAGRGLVGRVTSGRTVSCLCESQARGGMFRRGLGLTLEGVRKERLVFLLVYNLIRMMMLRSARRQGVNVNRLSFADTLAWLRHGELIALVALKINPLRPGRLEPRVIKRQKKEFPYMTRPRAQLKAELRARHGDTT